MIGSVVSKVERSFGKTPARQGAIKVMLEDHADIDHLYAQIPKRFGHYGLIGGTGWGMLANDSLGDCLCAGFLHHVMLWNQMAGVSVRFTDDDAVKVYEQMGGYVPSKPATDNGCDMETSFKRWRQDGVLGHGLDAYLGLKPGDLKQLAVGMYYCNGVGTGWVWTRRMVDDFNASRPIGYHRNDPSEGGHYTASVGRTTIGQTVTWGRVTGFTDAAYAHRSDEAAALLSLEMMKNGKSLDGFDKASILAALATATASGPKPISANG